MLQDFEKMQSDNVIYFTPCMWSFYLFLLPTNVHSITKSYLFLLPIEMPMFIQ